MTPETVKAIRLSLRTSRGRPPSARNLGLFLGMGTATIWRYEAGASIPSQASVNLLLMCRIPEAVKVLSIYNRREGRYYDIEARRDCAECDGYLEDGQPDEISALKVCRDCGSEWRC